MMKVLVVGFICLFVAASASRVEVYNRRSIPSPWIEDLQHPVSADEEVEFYVALHQVNTHVLVDTLMDVSNPSSPNYANWWNKEDIQALVAPPQQHHDAVRQWLEDSKVTSIIPTPDCFHVFAPVSVVDAMFQTEMKAFVHPRGRRILAHVGPISIPEEINQYIDMVTALSLFPPVRVSVAKLKEEKMKGTEQYEDVTAEPWLTALQLRQIYQIPENLSVTHPNNTIAAVEFETGCFGQNDIYDYLSLQGLPQRNVSRIIGTGVGKTSCDTESILDLELMTGVSLSPNVVYFAGNKWIFEYAHTNLEIANPPLVQSLSWGWMEQGSCEIGDCTKYGVDSTQYVRRSDVELAKIALMGLTIIVCTQDEGAPSDWNDQCQLDDTTRPVWPIYPATSPFVLAVGATTVYSSTSPKDSPRRPASAKSTKQTPPQKPQFSSQPLCQQITCNNGTLQQVAMSTNQDTLFTSGGGFSNVCGRQSFQVKAVQAYLNSTAQVPPLSYFNYTKRAYPDISAAGCKMFIVVNGQLDWNGGTSASTPITSAIFSLINDHMLNNYNKTLGYVGPLVYQMFEQKPSVYTDITIGNNNSTGWDLSTTCKFGYQAVPGWDASTGVGTPLFSNIISYLDNMMAERKKLFG